MQHDMDAYGVVSLPARGVWIEIMLGYSGSMPSESLPARGVWIEISNLAAGCRSSPSLPARGVWIEISQRGQ